MIHDTAQRLLAAALVAWQSTGRADPAMYEVVVGNWAMDDCCKGVLVLSVDQLVWWNPFPFESLLRSATAGIALPFAPSTPCIGTLGAAATLNVGLCIPVVLDDGRPPDQTAETAAMAELLDLVEVITTALACDDPDCWVIGGVVFNGQEGGCLLGQIAVRLDSCPAP
jgi:hypothetical protein